MTGISRHSNSPETAGMPGFLGRHLVPLVGLLGLTVVLSLPFLSGGIVISGDHPVHLAELQILCEEVLPQQGWITGWAGDDFCGFPFQMYFYQLSFWLMAVLVAVLPWSYAAIYGLGVFGCFLATVWAAYAFYGSIGGRLAGFVLAALLATRLETLWTLYQGTYNAVFVWSVLFLGFWALPKLLELPPTRSGTLLGGLWSLTFLTHPYMVLIPGLYALLIAATRFRSRSAGAWAAIFALGGGVFFGGTAFYLLPILETGDWFRDAEAGVGTASFAALLTEMPLQLVGLPAGPTRDLFGGGAFDQLGSYLWGNFAVLVLFGLSVAGMALAWRDGCLTQAGTLRLQGLMVLVSLVLASGYWVSSPTIRALPVIGMVQGFFALRFLTIARLCLWSFASYALGRLLRSGDGGHAVGRWTLVALLVVGCVVTFRNPAKGPGMMHTTLTFPEAGRFLRFMRTLPETLRADDGRVWFQSPYGVRPKALGRSHLAALFTRLTGRESLGGWCKIFIYPLDPYTRIQGSRIFGKPIDEVTSGDIAGMMNRFAAGVFVTSDSDLRPQGRLAAVTSNLDAKLQFDGNFTLIHEVGPFRAYRLQDAVAFADRPEVRRVAGRLDVPQTGRLGLEVTIDPETPLPVTLELPHAAHPYWRLASEAPVLLGTSPYELLEVTITEPGTHIIDLEFVPTRRGYVLLTGLTLLGLTILTYRRGVG